MSKCILFIIDGLNATVAQNCLGYLEALRTAKIAKYKTLHSELPSLSRPLYETILTGKSPIEHGIVSNNINRLSNQKSIFHVAKDNNKTTAAAAYSWISELYQKTPYASSDRIQLNSNGVIENGIYYSEDHYPDSHIVADAEYLRTTYSPDFLLIHSMNVDDKGHKHGLDSIQYRNSARKIDDILSLNIPNWIEDNYEILITADHGMHVDKTHGGTTSEEREIPLYYIGKLDCISNIHNQTDIFHAVIKSLGING